MLNRAINQVVGEAAFIDKLAPLGFFAVADPSPAALTTYIDRQRPIWELIVKLSGARVE
ncbi:MAG: hypothetical protein HC918_10945 [Oscillatoriales cyanobacterium SM2_1_8]|nr:hypothetical protein [Oscillatoriales cyanobacterium SM2_1_8]